MPIRDIFLTAFVLLLLPVCFLRPWIGGLVWAWLGYMNPHRLCWGFAHDLPFALVVALATMGGAIFSRTCLPAAHKGNLFALCSLGYLLFVDCVCALPAAGVE